MVARAAGEESGGGDGGELVGLGQIAIRMWAHRRHASGTEMVTEAWHPAQQSLASAQEGVASAQESRWSAQMTPASARHALQSAQMDKASAQQMLMSVQRLLVRDRPRWLSEGRWPPARGECLLGGRLMGRRRRYGFPTKRRHASGTEMVPEAWHPTAQCVRVDGRLRGGSACLVGD